MSILHAPTTIRWVSQEDSSVSNKVQKWGWSYSSQSSLIVSAYLYVD